MSEGPQKYGLLLLEKPGKARPLKIAADLARAAGFTRLDALIQLRLPYSFIMPSLNEENAQRAADFLVSRGIAAVPQPLDALDIQHGSGIIRNADPTPEGLLVQNLDGSEAATLPWKLLRGVFTMHRLAAPAKQRSSNVPPYGYGGPVGGFLGTGSSGAALGPSPLSIGLHQGVWAMLGHILSEPSVGERILFGETRKTENIKVMAMERAALKPNNLGGGSEDDVIVLVMGDDPVVLSLIERSGFNYDFLGEKITPSSKINFPQLIKDICRFARPLYVNNDVVSVIKNNTMPREKVKGKLASRWILEHVLALNLFDKGLVPPRVIEAIGDDESILVYLD